MQDLRADLDRLEAKFSTTSGAKQGAAQIQESQAQIKQEK
jgi:hypothetical protein